MFAFSLHYLSLSLFSQAEKSNLYCNYIFNFSDKVVENKKLMLMLASSNSSVPCSVCLKSFANSHSNLQEQKNKTDNDKPKKLLAKPKSPPNNLESSSVNTQLGLQCCNGKLISFFTDCMKLKELYLPDCADFFGYMIFNNYVCYLECKKAGKCYTTGNS